MCGIYCYLHVNYRIVILRSPLLFIMQRKGLCDFDVFVKVGFCRNWVNRAYSYYLPVIIKSLGK